MHLARILRNNTVLKGPLKRIWFKAISLDLQECAHQYSVKYSYANGPEMTYRFPITVYLLLRNYRSCTRIETGSGSITTVSFVNVSNRSLIRWRKSIGGADGTRTHIKRFCRPLRNQFRTRHLSYYRFTMSNSRY